MVAGTAQYASKVAIAFSSQDTGVLVSRSQRKWRRTSPIKYQGPPCSTVWPSGKTAGKAAQALPNRKSRKLEPNDITTENNGRVNKNRIEGRKIAKSPEGNSL